MKKISLYVVLIIFIVIADQYSKFLVASNFNLYERMPIIDGFLNFTFAKNSGAAFSFGTNFDTWVRVLIFKILPVGVCFWLFKLLYDTVVQKNKLMSFAYALILGGAIGNLIDRIRLDYVVDFISVYHRGLDIFGYKIKEWYFAIFNIADSAISIAAFLIILDFIFVKKKEPQKDLSETI